MTFEFKKPDTFRPEPPKQFPPITPGELMGLKRTIRALIADIDQRGLGDAYPSLVSGSTQDAIDMFVDAGFELCRELSREAQRKQHGTGPAFERID